jgi:hypothetical protein
VWTNIPYAASKGPVVTKGFARALVGSGLRIYGESFNVDGGVLME